ncbi:hypothetical protein TRFO_22848 [Tritrichomonas foetus]|uniref:Uncharacterized protein n=1 Tax=Tritrichomonas foetus TaxID=1144522 RepID=A0A1J4KCC4_9EUKA|nr:hypothetical protein TRFO_22848 [Tritrichomonas foetus]|eukprot:OHT08584.1 hypothetical protein TRFO_22848 [Tritrichomonas foetus]
MDNTVIQLCKISSSCEIFADQCVLNGYVPPHPGDLQRILNSSGWEFTQEQSSKLLQATISKEQSESSHDNSPAESLQNAIESTSPDENTNGKTAGEVTPEQISPIPLIETNIPESEIPEAVDISSEDQEVIKSIAEKSNNKLSQFTVNKIHEALPNVSTQNIRNVIRMLIAKGEIQNE